MKIQRVAMMMILPACFAATPALANETPQNFWEQVHELVNQCVIRTITVGGRTYAIRNERGFPLEHPGQNASATTESKGGQL